MITSKSSFHDSHVITPKSVTRSETLRCLAPWLHSYEEKSQPWQAVGDAVPDLTDPRFEPQTSHTDRNVND